jgi:hypothetical protein
MATTAVVKDGGIFVEPWFADADVPLMFQWYSSPSSCPTFFFLCCCILKAS